MINLNLLLNGYVVNVCGSLVFLLNIFSAADLLLLVLFLWLLLLLVLLLIAKYVSGKYNLESITHLIVSKEAFFSRVSASFARTSDWSRQGVL